jgi:hypothetical protein
MFFKPQVNIMNRIEPTMTGIDNQKVQIVLDKLQDGIHNWVATVLPSLTKEFNEKELEVLAQRLAEEFN